jgi:hypothetical protein
MIYSTGSVSVCGEGPMERVAAEAEQGPEGGHRWISPNRSVQTEIPHGFRNLGRWRASNVP